MSCNCISVHVTDSVCVGGVGGGWNAIGWLGQEVGKGDSEDKYTLLIR